MKTKQSERFEEVLAVYGAEPARWPLQERAGLERFAQTDRTAGRALAEAAALERVMARASAGDPAEALKQRIVAAAVADGARETRVVPLSAARAGKPRGGFGMGQGRWWPAAALAACFALGVYLGVAGLGAGALDQAFEYALMNNGADDGEPFDLFGAGVEQEGLL